MTRHPFLLCALVAAAGATGACHGSRAAGPKVLVPFNTTRYPPPWQHLREPHHGVDFATPADGRVIAIADGRVALVSGGGVRIVGVGLVVEHPSIGRRVQYSHFAHIVVKAGDEVRRGQVLGTVVRPGHPRGASTTPLTWIPHVHVEICFPTCINGQFEDPLHYMDRCVRAAREGDVVYPVEC